VDAFYHVVVPTALIGSLMMLLDIYASPWFSAIWWTLHPGP